MKKIIKRLLISSLLLLAISGCDEQKSSYRYKVVDKSRDIDSHYNFSLKSKWSKRPTLSFCKPTTVR